MAIEQDEGIKILLVDDDAGILESLGEIISKYGVIKTAPNGIEGLEIFKTFQPDIVISDINMPKMGGFELINNIKELSTKTKFALISAFDDTDILHKAIEAGVEGFLVKPFSGFTLKDVIERLVDKVKIQKELYIAKQHNEALLNFFIVTKTDKHGNITYANDNFCKISGYTQEELLGKSHNIVRHPETSDEVFKELWETISSKKVWQGVFKNRSKEGREYIAQSSIFPILDEEGEIVEFMAIREDVTELERLKKTKEEQEKKAAIIEQEKRVLEEINRAKDSFLILFTHELKTPLNAIINFSGYLLDKCEEGKYKTLLKSIERNSLDTLNMVENLLELAKIKSGKIVLNIHKINIANIAQSIVERYKKEDLEGSLSIVFEGESGVGWLADEKRVFQIVQNLVSNALKYGNKKVIVGAKEEQGKVFLYVEDNGEGFGESEKLFELFEQKEALTNKGIKGSGVGLHLVKVLCELQGITIETSSSERLGGAKITLSKDKEC